MAGCYTVYRVHVRNKANIRDGGKTVHVVFKYLSRSLLVERGGMGAGRVTPFPLTTVRSWNF
jgi:hypothetical protein